MPRVEVYNKVDQLSADERRRMQEADPAALLISAHTGAGCDELLESVAARLALDQQRVTIELDLANPVHAERLAWLYRHATVHSHATMGDRATLEADVPRRLLPMVGLATPRVAKSGRPPWLRASTEARKHGSTEAIGLLPCFCVSVFPCALCRVRAEGAAGRGRSAEAS